MASASIAHMKNKARRLITRLARSFTSEPKIIISVTSYPARMDFVHLAIESMFGQTYLPDKVVLYLYKGQFPNGMADIPQTLTDMQSFDFEIRWVDDDLRPHKKYYYALQDFPEDLVVTIDDDLLYRDTMIEELYASYKRHPHAISAFRTHLVMFDEQGMLAPYEKWIFEAPGNYPELVDIPSMALFGTTGAGTLFPPHILPDETFNKDLILKACLNADDVWMKVMQLLANVPVVAVTADQTLTYIPNSQDEALWHTNINANGNNDMLQAVLKACASQQTPDELIAKMKDMQFCDLQKYNEK